MRFLVLKSSKSFGLSSPFLMLSRLLGSRGVGKTGSSTTASFRYPVLQRQPEKTCSVEQPINPQSLRSSNSFRTQAFLVQNLEYANSYLHVHVYAYSMNMQRQPGNLQGNDAHKLANPNHNTTTKQSNNH